MGKPKTKLGKYCNFYLSNQSIAVILKHSNGNKSAFIDKLLLDFYEKEAKKAVKTAEEEANEVLNLKIE